MVRGFLFRLTHGSSSKKSQPPGKAGSTLPTNAPSVSSSVGHESSSDPRSRSATSDARLIITESKRGEDLSHDAIVRGQPVHSADNLVNANVLTVDDQVLSTSGQAPKQSINAEIKTGLEVATGPNAGRAPSPEHELWNEAWGKIAEEDDSLTDSYVQALSTLLGVEHALNASDWHTRERHLSLLLQKGQEKTAKSAKVSGVIGTIADTILKLKLIGDFAVSIPAAACAAIPWAGVCIGLEMLSNPGQATTKNREGTAYVVSRMAWYKTLAKHLLRSSDSDDDKQVLEQLRTRITDLYQSILLYQVGSVCSYYRNKGLNFTFQLVNYDDWDTLLKNVKAAEDQVLKDWNLFRDKLQIDGSGQVVAALHRIAENTSLVDRFIQQQLEFGKQNNDVEVLHNLHFLDPRDQLNDIEDRKDSLLTDLSDWVLQEDAYRAVTEWDSSALPQNRLLWIKGDAGTGKTMLMIGMIRALGQETAVVAPSLSYVFFDSRSADVPLSRAVDAVRSLLWMLLIQQPHLISHFTQDYRTPGAKLFGGALAWAALRRISRTVFEDHSLRPVYFVVDALDECDPDAADFLSFVKDSLSANANIRWIISSRTESNVIHHLSRSKPKISTGSIDMMNSNAGRLEKYVTARFRDFELSKGYDAATIAMLTKIIAERADKIMLWAYLVLNDLKTKRAQFAENIVRKYPVGLEALTSSSLSDWPGFLPRTYASARVFWWLCTSLFDHCYLTSWPSWVMYPTMRTLARVWTIAIPSLSIAKTLSVSITSRWKTLSGIALKTLQTRWSTPMRML